MTQDEIIEMAIQAELNLYVHDLTEKRYIEVIETFAKLVAEKTARISYSAGVRDEREAIAVWLEKGCDEQYLADRVRARGQV